MSEDFYNLTQINSLEFKYATAISDKRIDDWLRETLEENVDFVFNDTSFGTHACTIYVTFLNEKSAVAFKLRWI